TPLWLGPFVKSAMTDFDFSEIYGKLILQIILPVVIGFLLQRFFGDLAQKYSKRLSLFDKLIILLIIYKSFAGSFDGNIFSAVSLLDLLVLFLAVLALFYTVFYLIGLVARKFNFSPEDQITAQFCGTKKSLVHGTVFSKILFGNMASLGLMLLPIMIFHATQIFILSIIAGIRANRPKGQEPILET
ncbi:MAG: bile acid:sodium symporter, partial [Arenibacter sp.]|nr:bile acid:sodium symporter [Arenibacter sp.]